MNRWILLAFAASLCAQDRNPFAGDPAAAEAGKSHFRINCALCHGLGARGGGRGPDLTRAQKRHGSSDADLFRTIHDGVAGTDMPAAIGSAGVEMKDREIWQVITYLRSIEVKAPALTGNPESGRALFLRRSPLQQLSGGGWKRRPAGPRSDGHRRRTFI